jgi:hypothetical protein
MSLTVLLFLLPLQTLLRDRALALAWSWPVVSGLSVVDMGVGVASRLLALHPITILKRIALLIIATPIRMFVQALL